MAIDLRLQQKMAQQLVMTPQLQQAIKLLQLNHLELGDVLREEMEQNPVLEERADADDYGDGPVDGPGGIDLQPSYDGPGSGGEDREEPREPVDTASLSEIATDLKSAMDPEGPAGETTSSQVDKEIDWEAYLDSYSYSLPPTAGPRGNEDMPSFEATLTKLPSLHEHLRWQIQLQPLSHDEKKIAVMLIEEINDDGYLAPDAIETVAEDLGVTVDESEIVLQELQRLEPMGVAARDLRECLLIQCQHLFPENQLLFKVIDKHLRNVERRNFQAIAKNLQTTIQEVSEVFKLIGQLEPRPGRTYSDREPQYITPDIYVYKVGDEYIIVLNEDGLPKLKVSNYYRNALNDAGTNAKTYIQEKLRGAAWLIRSIHMRQRTIYRVMESILKFQRDFFDRGITHLKPLILKDVADDVGMHESTISRVTTNKYVHTPQGIYELKYFFNSSINRIGQENIASESVRDHIKRLIEEEDPRKPYSDQQIVELLKKRNIDIARRTVAKYREMMKLPSSSKRKQVF